MMSYISHWLLLVSVILQISYLKRFCTRDIFFDTPCIGMTANVSDGQRYTYTAIKFPIHI